MMINGRELHAQVTAYRRRVGCTMASFAMASGVSMKAIERLRSGIEARDGVIDRLSRFMRAHPDGFDGAIVSRRTQEPVEGAAAVVRAWAISALPARPDHEAVLRAAAEDRWARGQRARRAMVAR